MKYSIEFEDGFVFSPVDADTIDELVWPTFLGKRIVATYPVAA